ncbi:XPG/Rad2 endonuclease [Cinnamomum micranthum f. kanehirae]|uniref:XPG/Rad2 endonuclease n=1 Tax=Cinnamomum micranthum f. kanehirae TaxID=337451 RepID=A0A3S3MC62_9MAGN|nr:XPG/Rad2 endonuclease [Cinnamomum micranthum f. kanehirae]
MGVQGLWELLAPVGRRVSVETLAGKKLAIDASIWMIQFMKAMRDEKGEMVRNAHLLGFFRRICKLLFLRTKPVFVFDGGTPALKRRTVVARRRQRENAQAKIRKTAEKLLLNHLKARKLEELANDIKNMKDKDDSKGKKIALESDDLTENRSERNEKLNVAHSQESIDELLAASLAAEESGKFTDNASTSVDVPTDEEDDQDEEMMLPLMHNNVDPAVLAALPPSLQLDLLVQMRERLMAENRQKYQKVKKAPTKFSELQIQSYLKTVAFRREIDEVQKSAAGRGVGGVQTSRIASEANREFIFSSSFTGDKQILTSAGVERNGDAQHQVPATSESTNCISSTARFHSVIGTCVNEARNDFDKDVETYTDERGRVRVSRVRGLGIHMTRDLQRNLDLMKELELEKMKENTPTNAEAIRKSILGSPMATENSHRLEVSAGDGDDEISLMRRMNGPTIQGESSHLQETSILAGKTALEISFEDDSGFHATDEDDGLFAHLVAGSSISRYSSETVLSGKHSSDFASQCSLEKGMLGRNNSSFSIDVEDNQPAFVNGNNSDEGEVDWEEGVCDVPGSASPCPTEHAETVSRGSLEEEADIQEAIRRSLEDFTAEKSVPMCSETEEANLAAVGLSGLENRSRFSLEVPALEKDMSGSSNMPLSDVLHSEALCMTVDGVKRLETVVQKDTLQINDSPEKHSGSFIGTRVYTKDGYQDLSLGHHEVIEDGYVCLETSHMEGTTNLKLMEVKTTGQEKCLDKSNQQEKEATFGEYTHGSPKISSHASDAVASDLTDVLVDAHTNNSEAAPSRLSSEITNDNFNFQQGAYIDQTTNNVSKQELVKDQICGMPPDEGWQYRDEIASHGNVEQRLERSEASLDEEMLLLRQERMDLGDEQRKLERNAESVSSEMFAECQELLQMFGLPYIIAPMEAEAQCAYMELVNLVDGVVTDDSDVFLFGARSVYKNIFDDRKYVETYFMKDIETELGLTREKLTRMALLLGSDYTEGVSGIGIVNAIEVVNAFPEEDGLQKFREWLESPDPSILGKLNAHAGHNARKRKLKACSSGADGLTNNLDDESEESVVRGHDEQQSVDGLPDIKQIFMDKHRNVSKNWHIPSSFPSEMVISAYTSPQVDNSTEPFSWGKPDLFVLRKLCWERFGWSNQKADELLLPVLKEYSKHETQLRLEAFYTFNERFAKIRSQRIKKAVKGITGNRASELMDHPSQVGPESRKKRKVRPSGTASNISEKPCDEINGGDAGNEAKASEETARKQPRKKGTEKTESEDGHSLVQKAGRPKARNEPRGNARRRGRGRAGRGKGREAVIHDTTESSSSDGEDNNSDKQVHIERAKEQSELRRSARQRKQVKYTGKDVDGDSLGSSSNQSDENCSGTLEQESFTDRGITSDACGPTDENQANEPSLEGKSSRDYLYSGGGFCADEDDDHSGNPIQQVPSPSDLLEAQRIVSPVTRSSTDAHFSVNSSTNLNEQKQENMLEQQDDSSKIPQMPPPSMIEEGDSCTSGAVEVGLRAMPSLRRKKSKT